MRAVGSNMGDSVWNFLAEFVLEILLLQRSGVRRVVGSKEKWESDRREEDQRSSRDTNCKTV